MNKVSQINLADYWGFYPGTKFNKSCIYSKIGLAQIASIWRYKNGYFEAQTEWGNSVAVYPRYWAHRFNLLIEFEHSRAITFAQNFIRNLLRVYSLLLGKDFHRKILRVFIKKQISRDQMSVLYL